METSAKKAKRYLVEAISLSLDQVSSLLRLLSHNLHSKASPRLGCAPTRGENCRSACSVAPLLVATNTIEVASVIELSEASGWVAAGLFMTEG